MSRETIMSTAWPSNLERISAIVLSVPLTYSITIGNSMDDATQPLTRALPLDSFEKSHVSARWSVRRTNGRPSR